MRGGFAVLVLLLLCACGAHGSEPLNVYVVPHSHNDPGWWWPFAEYHSKWTDGIISSVVTALSEDAGRRFVWSEISFFARWWDSHPEAHDRVRALVRSGQLEFVGAGWVQNDEAVTDAVDILDQYSQGFRWLRKNIGEGATPRYAWAIDPFGHSRTQAMLHSLLGFEGMVINRIDRHVNEQMRQERGLEFLWHQPWDSDGADEFWAAWSQPRSHAVDSPASGMLTHVLAYKLYDIPNTCGPSWDTCASFDFERKVAEPITPRNVRQRVSDLLGQYREKAALFQHNHLLMPLGDDFKYKNIQMTREMFNNYAMMFEYINDADELNVNIRFATLSDYMDAVREAAPVLQLPRRSDEFFTYNDEKDDFWSGYFSTRPQLKLQVRRLSAHLHAARAFEALSYSRTLDESGFSSGDVESYEMPLEEAAHELALLQHHDGITGTCRKEVVKDYLGRLDSAIQKSSEVLRSAAQYLMITDVPEPTLGMLHPTQRTHGVSQYSGLRSLQLPLDGTAARLVLYSAYSRERFETVDIVVDACDVVVRDVRMGEVHSQISPLFASSSQWEASRFVLSFPVQLRAFGWTTVFVSRVTGDAIHPHAATIAQVSTLEASSLEFCGVPLHQTEPDADIKFSNDRVEAFFSSETGQLQSANVVHESEGSSGHPATHRGHHDKGDGGIDEEQCGISQLEVNIARYDSQGGSYLFKPKSSRPASVEVKKESLVVYSGDLVSGVYVETKGVKRVGIHSRVHHLPDKPFVEVTYDIDMDKSLRNTELVAQISTNIHNNRKFFTDTNNIGMEQRTADPDRALAGNFFPITHSAALVEDIMQLTVLTNHAMGVGSSEEGELQFLLDRRLNQDDGRGMGETVVDSVDVETRLLLVVEERPIWSADEPPSWNVMSPEARHLNAMQRHPIFSFDATALESGASVRWQGHLLEEDQMGSGVEILSIERLSLVDDDDSGSNILIRFGLLQDVMRWSCELNRMCADRDPNKCIFLGTLFTHHDVEEAFLTDAAGLQRGEELNLSQPLCVAPMSIVSVIVRLSGLPPQDLVYAQNEVMQSETEEVEEETEDRLYLQRQYSGSYRSSFEYTEGEGSILKRIIGSVEDALGISKVDAYAELESDRILDTDEVEEDRPLEGLEGKVSEILKRARENPVGIEDSGVQVDEQAGEGMQAVLSHYSFAIVGSTLLLVALYVLLTRARGRMPQHYKGRLND